jgi:hypothetical protein
MSKDMKLDSCEVVAFGQSLHEIEKLYPCKAIQMNLRYGRKGLDMVIELKDVSLEFDNARLRQIKFTHPYEFVNSPAPYAEEWKNFDSIGEKRIFGGMSRVEVLSYLTAWEERAKKLGAQSGTLDDLTDNQFVISFEANAFRDMIHISMGPSRRTGGGRGRWSDGWTLFFTLDSDRTTPGEKIGVLKSISAFRDEFNTVARGRKTA